MVCRGGVVVKARSECAKLGVERHEAHGKVDDDDEERSAAKGLAARKAGGAMAVSAAAAVVLFILFTRPGYSRKVKAIRERPAGIDVCVCAAAAAVGRFLADSSRLEIFVSWPFRWFDWDLKGAESRMIRAASHWPIM